MTLADAAARCRYWQSVLRLRDWNVVVKFGRSFDMSSPGAVGQCWQSTSQRRAIITLLDPVDFRPAVDAVDDHAHDIEDTIVHELLHLHFGDLRVPKGEQETPEQIAEERAIDAITGALVALDRRTA